MSRTLGKEVAELSETLSLTDEYGELYVVLFSGEPEHGSTLKMKLSTLAQLIREEQDNE